MLEEIREAIAGRGIDVIVDAERHQMFVRWAPGNGTCYNLLVHHLQGEVARALFLDDEAVMVTWVNLMGGRTLLLSGTRSLVHLTIVQRYFQALGVDLNYLTVLVNIFGGSLSYATELLRRIKVLEQVDEERSRS